MAISNTTPSPIFTGRSPLLFERPPRQSRFLQQKSQGRDYLQRPNIMFRVYKCLSSPVASSATAAAKFYSAAAAATKKSASSKAAQKTPKKSPATSKPTTSTKKPAALRTETRPTGINKVTPISPALGQFLGAQQSSRTEAVKQIWSYIKSKNLQNPDNKKEIFCDEKLKTIFDGKEKIGFLEIGKMLTIHFVKTT